MHVCFATSDFWTNNCGGAGVYAWNLTKNMAKMGHQVHVITWGSKDIESIDNLYVHRVTPLRNIKGLPPAFLAAFFILTLPLELLRLNKKACGFDIIHANAQFFTPLAVFLGSMLFPTINKIPKIMTLHHLDYTEYLVERSLRSSSKKFYLDINNKISGFIEFLVVRYAPAIIVVSNFTAGNLREVFDVAHKKIFVIPNGVALEPSNFLNFQTTKKAGDIWLLTVGRMEPRKGIPILVKAFENVSKSYDNLSLFLVGKRMNKVFDFQLSDKIRGAIKTFDRLNDLQLSALYGLCDIYVSASLLEGFGLTILEAMASGKPVVAVKCGAIPEFVKHGSNGFLVAPNDPNAIAEALKVLIANQKLRQAMGSHNKNYAEKTFTWEAVAIDTTQVYLGLLSNNKENQRISPSTKMI